MTPVAAAPPVLMRGVVRRFRNGRGLGPVDLEVGEGETVALMGRNGCGKTTLLRVLATVARPQAGALSWFGGGAAGARARIGLALDGALEDGGLSGRQATAFWCSQWIGGRDEVARRTDAILDALGLHEAADDAVSTYSFGMRRRLALAGALVHDPALALLDEPTAGLDPDGSADLGAILQRRARGGATTVVASNDPAFVEAAADRVAFLDEGRLLSFASTAELLAGLPTGRVAELELDGQVDSAVLRAVDGVTDVSGAGSALTVTFEGASTIAALVAAADAPGGRLRELRLRRPGLADCFRAATGHHLADDV